MPRAARRCQRFVVTLCAVCIYVGLQVFQACCPLVQPLYSGSTDCCVGLLRLPHVHTSQVLLRCPILVLLYPLLASHLYNDMTVVVVTPLRTGTGQFLA